MGGAFWNFGNLWWLGYLLAKNFDATFAKKCAKFRHGSIAAPFVGLPWAVESTLSAAGLAYSCEFRVASFLGLIPL
jgi:hypothetical protein